jgi:hypothetical protein
VSGGRGSLRIEAELEAVRVGQLPVHYFSEATLKIILSAALILGLCGLTHAQGEKADPVGIWKCAYSIADQNRTAELTIKRDGEKIEGTMTWPDQKDEKITDPKFTDGKLTFSVVRKFMDNVIPIAYTLTIDGDKFTGKGSAEFGGQKQEFDITGTREKKDK